MKRFLLLFSLVVWCVASITAATLTFDFTPKATVTNLPTSSSNTESTWTYAPTETDLVTLVKFTSVYAYKNTSNAYLMIVKDSGNYLTFTRPAGIIIKSITITASGTVSEKAVLSLKSGSTSGTQIGETWTATKSGSQKFEINETEVTETQY